MLFTKRKILPLRKQSILSLDSQSTDVFAEPILLPNKLRQQHVLDIPFTKWFLNDLLKTFFSWKVVSSFD